MQTITINRNNNKKMKNRGVIKGYKRGLFFQNYMEYKNYFTEKLLKFAIALRTNYKCDFDLLRFV